MSEILTEARPTARQLRYLKWLAQRSATTFTFPSTRAQASREIERLKRLPAELRVPRDERIPDLDGEVVYATAVRDHEVIGRGSSASWQRPARERADAESATARAIKADALPAR